MSLGPIDIGLSGGEGGLAISPSSGASGASSITAPFSPVTGGSSSKQETPYLTIGIGLVAALLLYRSFK